VLEMNLKTTAILVVLTVLGGTLWLVYQLRRSETPVSQTLIILEKEDNSLIKLIERPALA
jgi:hypothetical protein